MGYLKENLTSLFKKCGLYVSSVDSPQLKVAGICSLGNNRKRALFLPELAHCREAWGG